MTDAKTLESALAAAKVENQALTDQLCQARADLRRLGIADQNRTLIYSALSGVVGVVTGIGLGLHLARK